MIFLAQLISTLPILVAILPIILIGIFVYKKDKNKESSELLFKLFMGGVGSCFPAAFIGIILGNLFPEMDKMNVIQLLFYVFIVVALVEEFCKWFMLYRISYNNGEFDTLYDMVVYASFVALGFACFENILYVMNNGIVTGLVRAVTAVPGHVCDGILMGSYLALAKFNYIKGNKKLSRKFIWMSLFIPALTHGIYDFCLFVGHPLFILIFIGFVIALFIICVQKVYDTSKNDIKFIYSNSFCTKCGNKVNTEYCTKCGNKNI